MSTRSIRPALARSYSLGTVLGLASALAVAGCPSPSTAGQDSGADGAGPHDARNPTDVSTDADAGTPLDGDTLDAPSDIDGDLPGDEGGIDDAGDDTVTADSAVDADDAPDGSVPSDTGVVPNDTSLLLNGTDPMPCADPAVFSDSGANVTYYVYCTSMAHVWTTSDWLHFRDLRASTNFVLTGLSANGQHIGSWWAPGIVYSPTTHSYVMWVSVPDAAATSGTDGWSARSLAVLTSPSPTGPWTYRTTAINAGANEHYIDPFLFLDHDGRHYVFWKQYGGGVSSSLVGAPVDAAWQTITGAHVVIMNGYGGTGTWEDNVRENPAVLYEATGDRYHFLFSGGHWADDSYATGHALSTCGPLCINTATGGWHMVSSGDRGIVQVVRSSGDPNFTHGGPGGAVFQDDDARFILYAAAARSAHGDSARYLMRQRVLWSNAAPYVDTAGHHPAGL